MNKKIVNEQSDEAKMQKRLKLLRVEKNYTQAEIAKRLNISQQTYSNIEKGEGRLDVKLIKSICREYNVSSDYLLGLDDHQESASIVKQKSEIKFINLYAGTKKTEDE